jgi:hypothetical protein
MEAGLDDAVVSPHDGALAQTWLLLFTAFLPASAVMILLNDAAEEIGWTGFVFARFQDRHGPLRRRADDSVLLADPRYELLCRNAIMGNHGAGAGHLPAPAAGQPIDHWLALQRRRVQRVDRRTVSLHAQRHVNSIGLVAVVGLPQFEVLVIMAGRSC